MLKVEDTNGWIEGQTMQWPKEIGQKTSNVLQSTTRKLKIDQHELH